MERLHAWTLRRSPALRKSRAPFLWTQTWGGECRGRLRAAARWAAHLSVTLRVPPPLKERLWGASPEGRLPLRGAVSRRLTERCYRTKGFPQGSGKCRGR